MDLNLKQKQHDLVKEIYKYNNITVVKNKEKNEGKQYICYELLFNQTQIVGRYTFVVTFTSKKEKKNHKNVVIPYIYSDGFFADSVLKMRLTNEHISKIILLFKVSKKGLKILSEIKLNNDLYNDISIK